jgi:hypothetical protein
MKDYSIGKKTPTSKVTSSTPTPRRRKFFGRKQHGIKLSDYPAEELQNFVTKKDIFSPSPTSSDSSRRGRLTHLLRTPKFTNSKSNKTSTSNQNTSENCTTEYFFADCGELKVVNESDSTDTADEDVMDQKEDIKQGFTGMVKKV